MKKYFSKFLILLSLAVFPILYASGPQWWTDRGVTVPERPADDYAVANIGQLKFVASKAADEMNARLPGGAGSAINTLLDGWRNPPAEGVVRDDYAALTVGQLKAVGKLFYDRLIAAGVVKHYPWQINGADVSHAAVANLGQLKAVFSFAIPYISGDFRADMENGNVRLSWSGGNAGSNTRYVIERRKANGEWTVVGTVSERAFVDMTVDPGKTYEYRVKAILDDYESDYSGSFMITTPEGMVIRVSSPSDATVIAWNQGATINISVNGSVAGKPLDKVALYRGDFLVGVLTTAPYIFDFSVLEAGNYQLIAKAQSGSEVIAVSSPVSLTVTEKALANTTEVHSSSYGAFITTLPGSGTVGMSLPLNQLALWQGTIESVSGNTIMLRSGTALTPGTFGNAGEARFYAELVQSETGDTGSVFDIAENDESSLTCTVHAEGQLKAGDVIAIRKHRKLGQIFGSNNETGLKGGTNINLTAPTVDIIRFSSVKVNESGVNITEENVAEYYYDTVSGWSSVKKEVHNPIVYPDKGLLVDRYATTSPLTHEQVGLVRSWKLRTSLMPGKSYRTQYFTTGNLFTMPLSSFPFYTGDLNTGVRGDKKANLRVYTPDGGVFVYQYQADESGAGKWIMNQWGYKFEYVNQVPAGSVFSCYNTVDGVDYYLTLPRGN